MTGTATFNIHDKVKTGSILIVRLFALGDIVLTLPLVGKMRKAFPDAWIGYLTGEKYAEALAGDTGLDEVIALPADLGGQLRVIRHLRKIRPEVAIDLLSSPRSALLTRLCGACTRIGMDTGRRNAYYHLVLPRTITRDGKRIRCYSLDANLELGRMMGVSVGSEACNGAEVATTGTRYGTGLRDKPYGFPAARMISPEVASFLASIGGEEGGLVGIVAGATYPSKSWPLERFAELARRISAEEDLKPVVIWGPGEELQARELASAVPGAVLPPPTGIADAGALIGHLDILVGIDSGPKHVAVLMGIPTVTMFGPTDPRLWDPMNGLHRVIFNNMSCAEGCREKNCRPNRCMEDITVDEVMDGVRSLIGDLGTDGAGGVG